MNLIIKSWIHGIRISIKYSKSVLKININKVSFSELEKVGDKKDKTLKTRLEPENAIDNGSRKRKTNSWTSKPRKIKLFQKNKILFYTCEPWKCMSSWSSREKSQLRRRRRTPNTMCSSVFRRGKMFLKIYCFKWCNRFFFVFDRISIKVWIKGWYLRLGTGKNVWNNKMFTVRGC